jgi:hypothetical protein
MARLITADYWNEMMTTLGLNKNFSPSAYQLDILIVEASDWVENYCDRVIEKRTVTESQRGNARSTGRLILNEYPVSSVTSIDWQDETTDGVVDPANLRILPGGVLEFRNVIQYGPWYLGRVYTFEYVAGFDPIPSNIQRATALKVAQLLQPQYQGPQEREVFMVTNIEAQIVDLLEPYRRERIA